MLGIPHFDVLDDDILRAFTHRSCCVRVFGQAPCPLNFPERVKGEWERRTKSEIRSEKTEQGEVKGQDSGVKTAMFPLHQLKHPH
jgi:hypothetical protein